MQVREVIIQERYLGQDHYEELDIALLVLNGSVDSDSYIMPACVDFRGTGKLQDNETGYVSYKRFQAIQ